MRTITRNALLEFLRNNARAVVVLRGVSGAGKSTLAKWLLEGVGSKVAACIRSADNYFTDSAGVYQFDASKLASAHGVCLRGFLTDLRDNMRVIVDNTNTTATEAAPYMAAAMAYEVPVVLVTVPTPVDVAAPRNVHSVPRSTIENQAARLEQDNERLPFFWDCAILTEEV